MREQVHAIQRKKEGGGSVRDKERDDEGRALKIGNNLYTRACVFAACVNFFVWSIFFCVSESLSRMSRQEKKKENGELRFLGLD